MASHHPPKPLLQRGDVVGVVAPGFAVRPGRLRSGLRALRQMGFRVVLGEHAEAQRGYLAGSDGQRAADLNRMLRDPDVRAIWFARGGYGTARLLDDLRWTAFERRPKLLIGYSDLTALFARVVRRTSRVCLYGPVVTELGDPATYHAGSLRRLLRGMPVAVRFGKRQVLRGGRAVGRLAGGNLTVLSHLWGTRHAPELRGRVLFLEDVGEEAYRLDRMLTQLRMTGALKGVRAVLLGSLVAPPRRGFPPDRPVIELIEETFLPLGVPVVTDLPAGHLPGKRTLPLGGRVELDTATGRLTLWPTARR